MERFYKIAVLFALIFLIICLIGIGILLQYRGSGKYPLHPTTCPDLWTNSSDGVSCNSSSGKNVGTRSTGTLNLDTVPNICDKKKWATANGIRWDGVSNYTGCVL